MRQSLFLATCASLLCANSIFAQGANSKIASQKGWLTNLDQGKALAQKTGKPLMVVFRCEP